jgi:hypothetical protein
MVKKKKKRKEAPTRKDIRVTIKKNIPSQNPAKANAGNTVTFINQDLDEKILRFALDENGDEFHPIGLIIAPGPNSFVTIVAVDPQTGKPSSTAFYAIGKAEGGGRISADPDDDTYQVIVGSSLRDE